MDIHLECEVCFEDYDSSDRKPMILDCGHTLCHECLKLIHRTSRECPMDRKNISKEIQEISPNYTLMQLLQSTASKSQKSPRNLSENTHNRGSRKELRRPSRGGRGRGHHSTPRDLNPDPRPLANNPPEVSNSEEVKITSESKKKRIYKKRNVVFKNLPKQYDENQLLNICRQFGRIESHHFVKNRDRPGENIRLAYVLFENEGDAIEAILNMNGIEIEGNKITVEMWKEFDKKEKTNNKVKDIIRPAKKEQGMNPQMEDRQASTGRVHHSRGISSLRRKILHISGNVRPMISNQPEYEELLDFGENPIQSGQQPQNSEINFEERPSQPAQQFQRINPPQYLPIQAPIASQSQSVPHFQPSTIHVSSQPAQIPPQVPVIASQPPQNPPQRQALSSQPPQIAQQRPVISSQPPQNPSQRPVISSQPPQFASQMPPTYSQPAQIPQKTSSQSPQIPQYISYQSPQYQPQIHHQSHQYPPQIPINSSQPAQYPSQGQDIVSQHAQIIPQRSNIISHPQQTPNVYHPIPPFVASPDSQAPNSKPQAPNSRMVPTSVQPLDMILQSLRLNHPDSRPQHQQDLPIRSQYESNPSINPHPSPLYAHNNSTNLPSYPRPNTSENPYSSTYAYQLSSDRIDHTGGGSISRPAVIPNPYEARDNWIPNPYERRNDDSSFGRTNPYDRFNPNTYVRNPYEDPSTSNREYKYNNPYLNKK